MQFLVFEIPWSILYSKFLENVPKCHHQLPNYWVLLATRNQNSFHKLLRIWKKSLLKNVFVEFIFLQNKFFSTFFFAKNHLKRMLKDFHQNQSIQKMYGRGFRPQAPDAFRLNPPSQLVICYHCLEFLNQVRKESKTQSSKFPIHQESTISENLKIYVASVSEHYASFEENWTFELPIYAHFYFQHIAHLLCRDSIFWGEGGRSAYP